MKKLKPVSLEAESVARGWQHQHQRVTTGVSSSGQGLCSKRRVVSPSEGTMHMVTAHSCLGHNVIKDDIEKLRRKTGKDHGKCVSLRAQSGGRKTGQPHTQPGRVGSGGGHWLLGCS